MNINRALLILGLCSLGMSNSFAQQDIVTFTDPGSPLNNGISFTLGYEFTVTSPIMVTGLSAFAANPAAGLNENTPVGLWNSSQTLIASATVLAGTADPLTADGYFRYATLASPLTLPDGTYYVGAEFEGSVDKYTIFVGGQASISGVTYVQPQEINTTSLEFPSIGGGGPTGVFGGDVVVAAVPEPELTVLLSIGLFGLAVGNRSVFRP
jgi:hypothetical protein